MKKILAAAVTLALISGCQTMGTGEPAAPVDMELEGLATAKASQAVIYYLRADGNYDGWGLHLWDNTGDEVAEKGVAWDKPLKADGVSETYGAYWLVDMKTDTWKDFNYIMHKGDEKEQGGADQTYNRSKVGDHMFIYEGDRKQYANPKM